MPRCPVLSLPARVWPCVHLDLPLHRERADTHAATRTFSAWRGLCPRWLPALGRRFTRRSAERFDQTHDFRHRLAFYQHAGRAGTMQDFLQIPVDERRLHNDRSVVLATNLAQEGNAIHARHLNIRDDEVKVLPL